MAGRRAKRIKIWDSRSYLLSYLLMLGTFHAWFFEFSLRSFSTLCKIPAANIFKWLLLPQFPFNFNHTLEKACNPGKYRPLLFLVNDMALWREVTPGTSCTLPLSIKLYSFHLAKGQAERQCPWVSCFSKNNSKMYSQSAIIGIFLPIGMPIGLHSYQLSDVDFASQSAEEPAAAASPAKRGRGRPKSANPKPPKPVSTMYQYEGWQMSGLQEHEERLTSAISISCILFTLSNWGP